MSQPRAGSPWDEPFHGHLAHDGTRIQAGATTAFEQWFREIGTFLIPLLQSKDPLESHLVQGVLRLVLQGVPTLQWYRE